MPERNRFKIHILFKWGQVLFPFTLDIYVECVLLQLFHIQQEQWVNTNWAITLHGIFVNFFFFNIWQFPFVAHLYIALVSERLHVCCWKRNLLEEAFWSQKVIGKHSGRCWEKEEGSNDYFALVLFELRSNWIFPLWCCYWLCNSWGKKWRDEKSQNKRADLQNGSLDKKKLFLFLCKAWLPLRIIVQHDNTLNMKSKKFEVFIALGNNSSIERAGNGRWDVAVPILSSEIFPWTYTQH